MTDRLELKRSTIGLKYRMIITTISFSLFYIFTIWLIRRPFRWFDAEPLLGWFSIIFIYGVIIIGAILIMQHFWQKRSYFIKGNMLIVGQKNSLSHVANESTYRLDTVISAKVKQSIFGKQNNYGDIVLTVPRLNSSGYLVLKDIQNPSDTITKINDILNKATTAGLNIS